MLHQAFIFHLPSHITYFLGTCKQYNQPAIQYNTRFVSPFIYFLDNAYICQLVHRHSTLTWHHFCQNIWGNLLFSSSFCLKVLIAGPRSSSGQPTLTFYLKCQQRSLFLLGFPAKYSSFWFILAWHHNRIYMIYMHTSCLKICNGQTAVPNYIHIYFHRALYLIVHCIFGWDWSITKLITSEFFL